MVVGFHVMSFSVSVSETTYFCTRLIQSENGSPELAGPGGGRGLIGATSLQERVALLGELGKRPTHDGRVEVLHRPPAVVEAAVGVFARAPGSLHDTVEADELGDERLHGISRFCDEACRGYLDQACGPDAC